MLGGWFVPAMEIFQENGTIQSDAWWLVCTGNGNISREWYDSI